MIIVAASEAPPVLAALLNAGEEATVIGELARA